MELLRLGDGRFLVITVWKGTDSRYQIIYQDLAAAGSRPVMLIEGFEHDYSFVGNADTDDRVVPAHSFKYAAALQAAQAGRAPVLIRIETRAGHGAGTPTAKQIEDYADRWAFLVRNLRMQVPERYARKASL